MKAMRVMILAVVALTGCGPGGEDEGATVYDSQAQQALMPTCNDASCPEKRALIGPSGTTSLPQDPVPLHTGLTSPATNGGDGALIPR